MNTNSEAAGGKTRGRVIGQQQGARVVHRYLECRRLAGMQCQEPDQGAEFARRRSAGRRWAPGRFGPGERLRTMTLNFASDGGGHDRFGKIRQQIETAQLVKMNDRAGITDDRRARCISLLHAVPIGGLPS